MKRQGDHIHIRTSNIARLAWIGDSPYFRGLYINGKEMRTDEFVQKDLVLSTAGEASIVATAPLSPLQHSGRLQSILTTNGTIQLFVPQDDDHALSIALRIAHDLDTYHKLDAVIATHMDAQNDLGSGNIILIGTTSDPFIRQILAKNETPVSVTQEPPYTVTVNGQSWNEASLGTVDHLLTSRLLC
jgi:hypothetical protein